ncbi:MAG: SulP family inorganic anion transporter [Actinobacteria bacterium]|nr:MAG: SulP family inorganic anion transporter [Actinomycetota bacterium]REK40494.1 MAG: SulP family inorganic anion transporter [Actinomycetota bacterium]
MSRPVPHLQWTGGAVSSDLIAGVSVALILVPQALAYAVIAGVPPYVGLLAAGLPTIAAAPFASSRYLQTGPVAMTALLTFGALSVIATPFTSRYIALAALLALIVGVIRIGIGLTNLGFVAHFMSKPVMVGFTIGATTLISASQLPTLLGVERGDSGLLVEAWRSITSPADWSTGAIVFGFGTIAVILVSRLLGPRFPGVLITIVVATIVSAAIDFEGQVVGDIPTGLPGLSLDLPWGDIASLLIPGLVIALVGFTEAAAIASAFAAEDREKWDPSREFVAQGAANIASGLAGGFPVGGSFARSSLNKLAGARSRWSGAFTGLAVLASVPLAGLLEGLPSAVLAAIVITAAARLIKPREVARIWRRSRLQAGVAVVTLVATIGLSPRIDIAVLVGIALAVAVHLGRELRLDVEVRIREDVLEIEPNGVIYFASTPQLTNLLIDKLAEHPDLEHLVIDMSGVGRIDFTGGNALSTVITDAQAAGLDVEIVGVPDHARRIVNGVLRDLELSQAD